MAIVKVIELIAESDKSWEDATGIALKEAAKTIRGIKSIYVQDMQALVEKNEIVKYRVNAKISFLVSDKERD
jgi:dodecin